MTRSSFVATTGLKLLRTPSVRDVARRRVLTVVAAVFGFAAASIAVGLATTPAGPTKAAAVQTGPFSYFPSE